MKFTIEGFSQEAALSIQKEVKVKNSRGKEQTKILMLDQTDLTLLRWFVDFYPKMKKKIIGETQYAWVNYQSIINDLPLLRIEKRPVYNRFSKMCELGILVHYHDKSGGSYSYYGFGGKYNLLIETNHTDLNPRGYESKYIGGMYSNSEGVCIQIPTKDSSINNSSINNSSYEEKIEKEKPEVSKKANHKKEETEKNAPTSQEIVDAYNETCVSLPRVAKITDKRKRALKKISSKFSMEDIRTVFKKAQESSFLNGSTDKWSGATFDWLVKEDNVVKVLEGNYDDKNAKRKKRPNQSYNLDEFQNYSIFDDE